MDAVDAVLVRITDRKLEVVSYRQFPLERDLQQALREVSAATPLAEIARLDALLGAAFGEAALALLAELPMAARQVRAIGSHGQTVLHLPGAAPPRTVQIGDPNVIFRLTGITTVADFRRADTAAGGQGAPLAPAFHAWQFRSDRTVRVVLNIGGMANVTILPADAGTSVRGFDAGPGNALMDAWAQQRLGRDFDPQGQWAAAGEVQEALLDAMLAAPYFAAAPPKSTGKDEFNPAWLAALLEQAEGDYRDQDVQATLLELTAVSIAQAITKHAPAAEEVLACGGGIHNTALMKRLRTALPDVEMRSTAEYGIDPDAVEAVTFAWLARQRLENIPIELPSITGAAAPSLLGGIYG